jgi:GTP-binding protein EngB required for normal cell division
MSAEERTDGPLLSEAQQRHLRVTCEHIDKSLGEIEAVLDQANSSAIFPKYHTEIPAAQRRTIEGYIARIRAQLLRVLEGQKISPSKPAISALHSVRVNLTFVGIAVDELAPRYMRGYGELAEAAANDLNGIVGELQGLFARLEEFVAAGSSGDLKQRLERLEQTSDELEVLRRVEQVVRERSLVEFRGPIANILDRTEDKSFEIAVFGRVSSGKSSLLNAILETHVLPVGVTPITAVPTRIVHGAEKSLSVSFADRQAETHAIGDLPEFVTEQRNSGNRRHVSRLVVRLPAARLAGGVSFMDTPGLGSLATRGAAETLAYLPKCDLGVVLIDAASTLTPDDLQTILALNEATVPATVLLSKADLLSEEDRARVTAYVKEHIASECNLDLPVHAVSSVAGQRAMLDAWFGDDIEPLYARARELRAASLKRKIGALRESVVATLKMKLGREEMNRIAPEKIREAEATLRSATGKIESFGNKIELEMERMPANSEGIFEAAAEKLMALATDAGNRGDIVQSEIARAAISHTMQERVEEYQEQVEALARELSAALNSAAETLQVADRPSEKEFSSVVREMPIFEIAGEISIRRPAISSKLLGKKFATGSVARQLIAECGTQTTDAIGTYAELLRKWFATTLRAMKARFDAYADSYRASASRLAAPGNLSSEEDREVREAVRFLGRGDAEGSGATNSQTALREESESHADWAGR